MKIIENKYSNNTFENIKHIDDYGNEYWYARELQKVLEYKDWRNFQKVIDKAVLSANNSVSNEEDWVVEVNKPIKTGKGKEELCLCQTGKGADTFPAACEAGLSIS